MAKKYYNERREYPAITTEEYEKLPVIERINRYRRLNMVFNLTLGRDKGLPINKWKWLTIKDIKPIITFGTTDTTIEEVKIEAQRRVNNRLGFYKRDK